MEDVLKRPTSSAVNKEDLERIAMLTKEIDDQRRLENREKIRKITEDATKQRKRKKRRKK